MDNILFFVSGFITFILIRFAYKALLAFMEYRRRNKIWHVSRHGSQLIYSRKSIR